MAYGICDLSRSFNHITNCQVKHRGCDIFQKSTTTKTADKKILRVNRLSIESDQNFDNHDNLEFYPLITTTGLSFATIFEIPAV